MASAKDHQPSDLPSTNPTSSFWHSEPSPLLLGHRSTRNLPDHVDVVVIGSGITGTSIAYHLLTDAKASGKKLSVLMLEAREACWGATGRNGGHCLPLLYSHPHDPSIATFELANFHALADLCNTTTPPLAEFAAQHSVCAFYTPPELHTAQTNIETLRITAPEVAAHVRLVTDKSELKELRVPTAVGAVVTDVAARMWPYKFVAKVLEDLLTDSDLEFNLQTHTAVTKLSATEEGWDVTTPRGTVGATKVVLATNAYTSHLLPGYADLIVPCRGQMSALVPTKEIKGQERLKGSYIFLADHQDDYLIQRPSGEGEQLMFGGGRQFGHTIGVADDEVVNADTEDWLKRTLPRVFAMEETVELEAQYMWSGIMGFSRDEVPFVGTVPGKQGLFISAGYTGHGMPNAWLCGKAVSVMVEKSLGGATDEHVTTAAIEEVGLPRAYLATEDRYAVLRQMPTVLEQDHMHIIKPDSAEVLTDSRIG